jgi:FdrA protein
MIDQSYRLARIKKEALDPETGVILLDVVLGYGCNADPAGEIVQTLVELFEDSRVKMGSPIVVASVCGTHRDPQDYYRQRDALETVGVLVAETNVDACELALEAVRRG